jgi:peptide/nickel transport system substrate-binding protein
MPEAGSDSLWQVRITYAAIMVGIAGLVAGCTQSTPTATGQTDGTSIVIADQWTPTTLNPVQGFAPDGASKIFDGLIEHGVNGGNSALSGATADLNFHAQLATEVPSPAADNRSWTVRVRQGVKFSDGSALTAADVVATYKAILGSSIRAKYWMLADVVKVDAVTVRFDLSQAYAPFLNLLTVGIVPASQTGSDDPIGTGPYKVTKWTKSTELVLGVNAEYRDVQPKITTVTVKFLPKAADRTALLAANKMDATCLDAVTTAATALPAGFNKVVNQSAQYLAMTLPVTNPATSDAAIRQALNYAIDRDGIVKDQLHGYGSSASTPVTAATPEFVATGASFTLDAAKARSLLDSAGWKQNGAQYRTKNGASAQFTLDYAADDPTAAAVASALSNSAKVIGIGITPKPLADMTTAPKTEAAIVAAGTPFDPDLYLYDAFHTSGSANVTGYSDASVDAALAAGRTQTDPAARQIAYWQFQQAYVLDPAMVVIANLQHVYYQRTDWKGQSSVMEGSGSGFEWGLWWNLATWKKN